MTKYQTECSTKQIRHEMVEDHPNCRVELMDKCDEAPDKFGNCKKVSFLYIGAMPAESKG